MAGKKVEKADKRIIGYTAGVYDMFHIGHLNVLRNAKNYCDKLIVAVSTDELVQYKYKKAVVPYLERVEILQSIRHVDVVIPQKDMDKFEAWKKLKFDVMFVGDDWYNTPKWNEIEKKFKEVGVKIVYFPYTKETSSTILNETLIKLRKELVEKEKKAKN